MVVLAHLQRRWSSSGREGFGDLLFLWKWNVFFPLRRMWEPKAKSRESDASYGSIGHWRQHPVFSLQRRARTKWSSVRLTLAKHCAASGGYVTLVTSLNPRMHRTQWHPFTHHRTRLVSKNHLWMLTGVHQTLGVERWVLGIGRVRCSLKWPLNFECARHVVRSGAPDAAECVQCLCVGASNAPDFCPTALFKGVYLYIGVWPVLGPLSWLIEYLRHTLS
jgi:hypothetical protein